MKKIKRLIGILLAFILVCGFVPVETKAAVPTQAEALAWIRSQVGRGLDMDGVYGNQCVDLILAYYDFLGVPRSSGNAKDYAWNTLPSGFQRIQGAAPQPGDILIYSASAANSYGHVAIYESDWSHYHQNFNGHSYVECVTAYRYNALSNAYWGVIRPNFGTQSVPVSMTWGNDDCQPDASNVYVYSMVTADRTGTFTKAGLRVWDETGKQVVDIIEDTSITLSYMKVWYNVTNDTGVVLESGTNYTYQFWAVFNGVAYDGPVRSFTTTGSKPLPFTDVAAADWFYDSVKYAYNDRLMMGTDSITFSPYQNLSRAQFAVVLYRMNGEPQITYSPVFPDVATGTWYTDAVLWANSKGVITGYANKMFGPADNLTREQMAVMMYRYANYLGKDTSVNGDFSKFKDASSVSEFATEAMKWAVTKQIITGKENGTMIDPQGNTARAEAAAIIQRFMMAY